MARKSLKTKQSKGIWWKILIVLTFIISLICLGILVQNKLPKYEYYTKIIILDDTNVFEYLDGKLVDYLCDEGVYFDNHRISYYASTSDLDVPIEFKGSCMIKVRRRI